MNDRINVKSIEKQISDLHWNLNQTLNSCGPQYYWANQGGFTTPRRETPEMVLADIKELSRIEAALDAAETKLR